MFPDIRKKTVLIGSSQTSPDRPYIYYSINPYPANAENTVSS